MQVKSQLERFCGPVEEPASDAEPPGMRGWLSEQLAQEHAQAAAQGRFIIREMLAAAPDQAHQQTSPEPARHSLMPSRVAQDVLPAPVAAGWAGASVPLGHAPSASQEAPAAAAEVPAPGRATLSGGSCVGAGQSRAPQPMATSLEAAAPAGQATESQGVAPATPLIPRKVRAHRLTVQILDGACDLS